MRSAWVPCVVGLALVAAPLRAVAEQPLAEKYLHEGKLAEGEKALLASLQRSPTNDVERFGLGVLQFVRAVEHLGQSLHRYGLRSERARNIPFLRLPVPHNPKPEVFTYSNARKILQDFIDDLTKAERTLAKLKDDKVKLPLRLGLIRLDLVGDGKAGESLTTLLTRYMGGARGLPDDRDLLVIFRRGDVAWLRGYCHLLMALAEVGLAYDGKELFDCTAHIFFPKVKTPHTFLEKTDGRDFYRVEDGVDLIDVIALIHLIRMPVQDASRMRVALGHLEKMLSLSRESWKYILQETDDDHVWIPNPRQTGVLGVPVRQPMIDSWLEFVEEAEALLAGKRLVPFWRGKETRGVNLRRVFTEPRSLDLVLWLQGTAATPYLEKGPLTKPEVWRQLQRVFGGEFVGFAIWFN